MRGTAEFARLKKALGSLKLDSKTLDAKRILARETARFLIVARDLMNAHFLARPVYREDILSDGLHYFEDKQGFYCVILYFPHFDVDDSKQSFAFIQMNESKDYDGSDKGELKNLTEGLHGSFSAGGLCKILLMLTTFWRKCEAEGRKSLALHESVARMADELAGQRRTAKKA